MSGEPELYKYLLHFKLDKQARLRPKYLISDTPIFTFWQIGSKRSKAKRTRGSAFNESLNDFKQFIASLSDISGSDPLILHYDTSMTTKSMVLSSKIERYVPFLNGNICSNLRARNGVRKRHRDKKMTLQFLTR
mmetsp:Transcript_27707/g.30801  ORF Transcript_27707/g.30801 Transcript_27707/m.30801 type:complete len:134 (-) Transcript_27707:43-444(-)